MANREGRFKKLGRGVRQIALHRNTKGASNRNRIFTILCLFVRFHSRERLLGRRTAAMCSFVISNKISTSLSSNIYRSSQSIQPFFFFLISSSSQCTMIWTAVAALQALHWHLHHFRPKTNCKHQGQSDHIDYS